MTHRLMKGEADDPHLVPDSLGEFCGWVVRLLEHTTSHHTGRSHESAS